MYDTAFNFFYKFLFVNFYDHVVDRREGQLEGALSLVKYISQDLLLAVKGKLPFRVTFPDGHFPVTDSI